MVFTSKIAFNTSSFTVNVNEHPELLFLNGKKGVKGSFWFIFYLGIPEQDLRRNMET